MSYPSLHEIRAAADEYWSIWQELMAKAPDLRKTVGQHSPTALGWKVEGDMAPLEAAERVYELGDHVMAAPVNQERAILTIRKSQAVALDTLQDIKILQRRPSRPDDALGADSLDILVPHGVPSIAGLEQSLKEAPATVKADHNDSHSWVSITYQGHEFKLQDHTVWDVCVREAAALLE
jgi:hypothetical protein